MEQGNSDEFKYLAVQSEGLHFTPDGTFLELGVHSNIEDPEERIEVLADVLGTDPENIIDSNSKDPRARAVIGFSKWRSNWDPHAQGDPNLN